jgi:hypothetical protein
MLEKPAAALAVSENSFAARARARRVQQEKNRENDAVEDCKDVRGGRVMLEKPAAALAVSENSFAARTRARRALAAEGAQEDAATVVERSLKSLLNKLTLEKFADISGQLLEVPVKDTRHVEILIKEIFEKAITQHHLIEMYSDLCSLVHEHFQKIPPTGDPKFTFKRLLLEECQASFERNLKPPMDFKKIADEEERTLAEFKYKNRRLGNVKFIGALLQRKMLAGKVFIAILEELLQSSSDESLESVAALLSTAGPLFDHKGWQYHVALGAIFAQVRSLVSRPACTARSRCLLQNVLDLRANGWEDQRAVRKEVPTTLSEVSRQAAREAGGAARALAARAEEAPRLFRTMADF